MRNIGITALSVLFTWLLHEFAHWCTGEWLGNTMTMTLNASYPTSGSYVAPWHDIVVSAAGPVITLIEAILFYVLLKRSASNAAFPFLLACFYMRLLAALLNFINLNDEGRISRDLKLGVFTLPVLITGVLFYLTYAVVKTKSIKTKHVVLTLLLILFFSSVLVLADQAWKLKIL